MISTVSAVDARDAPDSEGESSPLLVRTADKLRHMILDASKPGAFLGSEKDLTAILGVSRPTFRQAAKLLMHENLLTIKRGIHGGFFSQSPSGEAVSRSAALYLNMHHTTLRQISDVVTPLQAEAARLLANHPDPRHRVRLRAFVKQFDDPAISEEDRHPFRRMLAYETLLGDLAGNPAIALIMKVMRDMLRDPRHGHFKINVERATAYEQFQRRLADAIADGDAEMATLICQRHTAVINRWLDEAVLMES